MIKDTMVVMEMLPELFRFLPKQANHKEYINADRNVTSNMEGVLCRTSKWECQAVEVSPKFGPSLSLLSLTKSFGWVDNQLDFFSEFCLDLYSLIPSKVYSQVVANPKNFWQIFLSGRSWAPGLSLETAPNPYFSETAISYALTFTFYEIAHWLIDG